MYSDNNKSHGSVATHLRCGGLASLQSNSNYRSVCWWKKLKLVHFWQSYRQNGLIASHALFEVHCPGVEIRTVVFCCFLVNENVTCMASVRVTENMVIDSMLGNHWVFFWMLCMTGNGNRCWFSLLQSVINTVVNKRLWLSAREQVLRFSIRINSDQLIIRYVNCYWKTRQC